MIHVFVGCACIGTHTLDADQQIEIDYLYLKELVTSPDVTSMVVEYKEQVKRLVLDEQLFVSLTLKGLSRESNASWRRVTVRPVLIKKERYLQFSYFNQKQDITKNYHGSEVKQKLDEILALPFNSIVVQSTMVVLRVQITPQGKAIQEYLDLKKYWGVTPYIEVLLGKRLVSLLQ